MTFAYGAATDAVRRPGAMEADAARAADAVVVAFDGLGHFGPLERPDRVAAGVIAALRSPDDTSPPDDASPDAHPRSSL